MDTYKHQSGMVYTEGVRWLAEQGACYWWLDLIASYQSYKRVKAEEFQHWRLRVNHDKSAVATMTDGNSDTPIVTQKIEFTDFGQNECELYLLRTPGQPPTLMQPCEY